MQNRPRTTNQLRHVFHFRRFFMPLDFMWKSIVKQDTEIILYYLYILFCNVNNAMGNTISRMHSIAHIHTSRSLHALSVHAYAGIISTWHTICPAPPIANQSMRWLWCMIALRWTVPPPPDRTAQLSSSSCFALLLQVVHVINFSSQPQGTATFINFQMQALHAHLRGNLPLVRLLWVAERDGVP